MTVRRYEHFEHDADVGVRGFGPSLSEAFAQAARGLTAVVTDPDHVRGGIEVAIRCEAPDLELLFMDWLNELIFEMSSRSALFGRFDVTVDETGVPKRLTATAFGEAVDRVRHDPIVEVKGATLTELRVNAPAERGEPWVAQCVVDV